MPIDHESEEERKDRTELMDCESIDEISDQYTDDEIKSECKKHGLKAGGRPEERLS